MSEYFNIVPSNNSSTGIFSFSAGTNLCNFIIPKQANSLVGSSIRLCGRISVAGAVAGEFNLNPRVGLLSLIDSISISSHETGQNIETIKFFSRFLSSFYSTINSNEDLQGFMSITQASAGSFGGAVAGVGTGGVEGATNIYDFSFVIPTGLFLSAVNIPLDKCGGLFISLNLSNDQSLFRADVGKSPIYSISDVHLSGLIANGSTSAESMTYNSISSYYGIVNSAFATLQYNLSLSKVLGAWLNFVPSEFTNSYLHDGQATMPIMSNPTTAVSPTEVNFLKGGMKFPLDYSIRDEYTESATLFNSQIMKNYMNSVKKFSSIGRTDISPINSNFVRGYEAASDNLEGDVVYGIGVRLDATSDSGVSYMGDTFGVTIASNLNTNYNNSAYLFVHHKNTLVFANDGLRVLN